MNKLIDVFGKILLVVMLVSTLITTYWWGRNWGSYHDLKLVMDDSIEASLTDKFDNKPLFLLTPVGPRYIMLNYSVQMIDMSEYMANLFALKTVLKNGGSQEDYDNGVVELNSKYMFYKELPEEYDIFNKYIDLDNNIEPVNVESDIAGQATIDLENKLNELIFYGMVNDILFSCIRIIAFMFLIEFIIRKFKKNNNG